MNRTFTDQVAGNGRSLKHSIGDEQERDEIVKLLKKLPAYDQLWTLGQPYSMALTEVLVKVCSLTATIDDLAFFCGMVRVTRLKSILG